MDFVVCKTPNPYFGCVFVLTCFHFVKRYCIFLFILHFTIFHPNVYLSCFPTIVWSWTHLLRTLSNFVPCNGIEDLEHAVI